MKGRSFAPGLIFMFLRVSQRFSFSRQSRQSSLPSFTRIHGSAVRSPQAAQLCDGYIRASPGSGKSASLKSKISSEAAFSMKARFDSLSAKSRFFSEIRNDFPLFLS